MFTIIGFGAVGRTIAAFLQQSSIPYNVIGNFKEYYFESNQDNKFFVKPMQFVKCCKQPEYIICCVKAFDVEQILEKYKESKILLVNNGILKLKKELKLNENVFFAINTNGSMRMGNSVYHTKGNLYINSNQFPLHLDKMNSIIVPNQNEFIKMLWMKFAVNCVINSLTAMHNITNGILIASYTSDVDIFCNEISDIIDIPAETIYANVKTVCENTFSNKSSMLMDVLNQRQTEYEYLTGYLTKLANPYKNYVFLQNVNQKLKKLL